MNNEFITIVKKPSVKNCTRISSQSDIPEFLQDVVKVEGDNLVLDSLEGEERVPLGSVIAYEQMTEDKNNKKTGDMNVWNKANWETTTREVDGVFYELSKPNLATPVTDTLPDEVVSELGPRLTKLEDGSFQIDTGWGLVSCKPNDGYAVIYGKKEDGSLDANFLTKGTPSFEQYYVVDEQGNIIQSLTEYDEQMQQENKPKSL